MGLFKDRAESGCYKMRLDAGFARRYLAANCSRRRKVCHRPGSPEPVEEKRQIVLQYCDEAGSLTGYPYNPNGSQENIAGICDETGHILGLMPHPERHVLYTQHPRMYAAGNKDADGRLIFKNGVRYAAKHL